MLIERERSCLLVVDVQERLAPVMSDAAMVIRQASILMQAAARLSVPVLVSEQYPQGLGRTVPELRAQAPESAFFSKISFSCSADPALGDRIGKTGRDQIVICGIEAHVCVLQTALGLQQQ